MKLWKKWRKTKTELEGFSAAMLESLVEHEAKYLKEYMQLCIDYGFIIVGNRVIVSTENDIIKRVKEIGDDT